MHIDQYIYNTDENVWSTRHTLINTWYVTMYNKPLVVFLWFEFHFISIFNSADPQEMKSLLISSGLKPAVLIWDFFGGLRDTELINANSYDTIPTRTSEWNHVLLWFTFLIAYWSPCLKTSVIHTLAGRRLLDPIKCSTVSVCKDFCQKPNTLKSLECRCVL